MFSSINQKIGAYLARNPLVSFATMVGVPVAASYGMYQATSGSILVSLAVFPIVSHLVNKGLKHLLLSFTSRDFNAMLTKIVEKTGVDAKKILPIVIDSVERASNTYINSEERIRPREFPEMIMKDMLENNFGKISAHHFNEIRDVLKEHLNGINYAFSFKRVDVKENADVSIVDSINAEDQISKIFDSSNSNEETGRATSIKM